MGSKLNLLLVATQAPSPCSELARWHLTQCHAAEQQEGDAETENWVQSWWDSEVWHDQCHVPPVIPTEDKATHTETTNGSRMLRILVWLKQAPQLQ